MWLDQGRFLLLQPRDLGLYVASRENPLKIKTPWKLEAVKSMNCSVVVFLENVIGSGQCISPKEINLYGSQAWKWQHSRFVFRENRFKDMAS